MVNYKAINLTVFSSKYPYEIIISTCDGQFIARKNITTNSSNICLCTSVCCFKISAKFQNQTLVKTINLSNLKCQNIFAEFNFVTITPNTSEETQIQDIILLDKNYHIPIPKAILEFDKL